MHRSRGSLGCVVVAVTAMFLLTFVLVDSPSAKAFPNETIGLSPGCESGFFVDVNGAVSPGAFVTSITWDWGDGTTTTGFFAQGHLYSAAGSYTITVTAHFSDGTSVSTSEGVTVPQSTPTNCAALTIASHPGGSVSFSWDGGSGVVAGGTSAKLNTAPGSGVSIIATPIAGFDFVSWSLSGTVGCMVSIDQTSSSNNACTPSSGTVTANFSAITGVPEFPFGLVLLFALLVPAYVLLKKKLPAALPSAI